VSDALLNIIITAVAGRVSSDVFCRNNDEKTIFCLPRGFFVFGRDFSAGGLARDVTYRVVIIIVVVKPSSSLNAKLPYDTVRDIRRRTRYDIERRLPRTSLTSLFDTRTPKLTSFRRETMLELLNGASPTQASWNTVKTLLSRKHRRSRRRLG